MNSRLPYLIHLAGAFPIRFRDLEARLIFRKTEVLSHYQSIFSNKKGLLNEQMAYQDNDFETMIRDRLTSLEFLISIRVGWLPFRSENAASFEVYNPHRCARQFGYDQTIPQGVLDFEKLSGDLFAIAECWQTLLQQKTGSSYVTPTRNRSPKCSFEYLRRHSMHTRALFGYKISDVFTPPKRSFSRRLIKRPTSGQSYGFEFYLSQSTSSKWLKMSSSRTVSSNLNKHIEGHKLNSSDGELPSDNISSQPTVNDDRIDSNDILDAEGLLNTIDLVEPSTVSNDSSEDVIGALKGIVHAPKELIKESTFCADPAGFPTNSDAGEV